MAHGAAAACTAIKKVGGARGSVTSPGEIVAPRPKFAQAHEEGVHFAKDALTGESTNTISDVLGGGITINIMQIFGSKAKFALLYDPTLTATERKHVAAALIQRTYRGHVTRSTHAAWYHRVNLSYEAAILRERKTRRGLLVGFIQRAHRTGCRPVPTPPPLTSRSPRPLSPPVLPDVLYMIVLASAIMSGPTVGERFEVEGVLASSIVSTGLEDVVTLGDYTSWLTSSFVEPFAPDDSRQEGRIFLNTYNEVIGSLRIEVMKVNSDLCAWKPSGWQDAYRLQLPNDQCYGWFTPQTMENVSAPPARCCVLIRQELPAPSWTLTLWCRAFDSRARAWRVCRDRMAPLKTPDATRRTTCSARIATPSTWAAIRSFFRSA